MNKTIIYQNQKRNQYINVSLELSMPHHLCYNMLISISAISNLLVTIYEIKMISFSNNSLSIK